MANLASSQKQARKNIKRREINLARKTAVKTAIRKVFDALEASDAVKAQETFKDAQACLARAKGKGLIHANNAARKMSRLAQKVQALSRSKS